MDLQLVRLTMKIRTKTQTTITRNEKFAFTMVPIDIKRLMGNSDKLSAYEIMITKLGFRVTSDLKNCRSKLDVPDLELHVYVP